MAPVGGNDDPGGGHQPQSRAKSADPLYAGDEELLLEVLVPSGEAIQIDKQSRSHWGDGRREKHRQAGSADADQLGSAFCIRLDERKCGQDVLNTLRML